MGIIKPDKQARISALRLRAEEALVLLAGEATTPQLKDHQYLLHELDVYQAEIEIQNEDLWASQAALAESRDAYAALYNLAPVGYFTINEDDIVLEANDTGIGMLAVEHSVIVSHPFTKWIERESQDQYYLYKQAVHHRGKASCELQMVNENGQRFEAQLEGVQLDPNSDAPSGLRLAILDITQKKQAQRHLRQQEILASVGQLATGIAHDFNNILQIIITYAHLVQQGDLPESSSNNLGHIIQQSHRAAELVSQLLDYSRRSPSSLQPTLLCPLLKETVTILERVIPKSINIRLHIEAELNECAVRIDVTQIQQVFINLAFNAVDAMPAHGHIDIHLSKMHLQPNEEPPAPEMEAGQWVILTFTDSGSGIAPEHIDSIFEPFFTTKGVGQGSGLGLAQVHGIIGHHGGVILVDSPASGGTAFTIYLPETESAIPSDSDVAELSLPHGKAEVILLVEDDPSVLDALKQVTEHLGYTVVTAINGEEGLAMLERYRASIRLVMTDMAMPVMDGIAMAKAIYQQDPTLPVIALSGYPLNSEAAASSSTYIIEWLPKPINLERLALVLAQHVKPKTDPHQG